MDDFDLPDDVLSPAEDLGRRLLVHKNLLLLGLGAFGVGLFLGWKLAGGTEIEQQMREHYADANPFIVVDAEPNPKASEPLPPVNEVPDYTQEN